jgi:hypothetical protein
VAKRGEYDERAVRPATARDTSHRREGPAIHQVRPLYVGNYEEHAMFGLSPERCAHFFARTESALWSVTPAVRRLVAFWEVNLAGRSWPVQGPFDVIFCRNVLMYLEACRRHAVLERMASLLAQGALLILDPTEHSGRAEGWFSPVAAGVYSRRCESSEAGAPTFHNQGMNL